MPFLLQVILVLVVLGFAFWLVQRHIQIASPFREVLYFVIVMALVFWLLEGFGILHTHYMHR